MAEDWTARGSLPGLDIEIRGGHADDRREYLVLALKGAPDLERALAQLAPWPMTNPWQPWLAFWQAAWAPWLAMARALTPPPRGGQPGERP